MSERAWGDGRKAVQSVLRACEILKLFTHDHPEWELSDLTRATGLSKATVHRLLGTLELAGFIVRRGQTYAPTMTMFWIGSVAAADLDVRREARPTLSALATKYGDTAYLFVPEDGHALCLERVDGDAPIKVMTLVVGKSLPLDRGAASTVLLAHCEDELLPYVAKDQGGAVNQSQLRARLAEIRADGYSMIVDEIEPGAAAVAAPVFGPDGGALAAISLGGPTEHFKGDALDEMIADVRAGAVAVSRRLGWSV